MTKLVWAKLKFPFSRTGRSPKEQSKSLSNKLNVNEEYKEAFRTKSYVEMCIKLTEGKQESNTCIDGASSSSSPPFYFHLSDYLLEAQQQETIRGMLESLETHQFLVEYFEASLEACKVCDLLLGCINQTRTNYKRIKRVIKLSKRVLNSADLSDQKCAAIFRELAACALLKNPLAYIIPVQFCNIHDNNVALFNKLTSEQKKIRRKAKFFRICKKIGGYSLVLTHTVLIISMLAVTIHSLVGLVAAPGLVGFSVYILRKKIKLVNKGLLKTSLLERHCAQLDLAAKGTYILINYFDTMSRLAGRLHDEVEHRKVLADMCVKSKKTELLKEVVKELAMHDTGFLEQLEELEKHVYLCFHTIDKSRRLVLQETMIAQEKCTADDRSFNKT